MKPLKHIALVSSTVLFAIFIGSTAMTSPEPKSNNMGLTSINKFINSTGGKLSIYKREDSGNSISLSKDEIKYHSMWIPWVGSKSEFESKTIDIQFENGSHIYIWQRNVDGDDRIRFSTKGWADPGEKVSGNSSVNGDRTLTIFADRIQME